MTRPKLVLCFVLQTVILQNVFASVMAFRCVAWLSMLNPVYLGLGFWCRDLVSIRLCPVLQQSRHSRLAAAVVDQQRFVAWPVS